MKPRTTTPTAAVDVGAQFSRDESLIIGGGGGGAPCFQGLWPTGPPSSEMPVRFEKQMELFGRAEQSDLKGLSQVARSREGKFTQPRTCPFE